MFIDEQRSRVTINLVYILAMLRLPEKMLLFIPLGSNSEETNRAFNGIESIQCNRMIRTAIKRLKVSDPLAYALLSWFQQTQ